MPDVRLAKTRGAYVDLPVAQLPHNLEAERSVLGAILLDKYALADEADRLDPADFYSPAHGLIFGAMLALAKKRRKIDLVTVKKQVTDDGHLDAVGGPAYICALVDGVPRSTPVAHYAQIVKEHARLRMPG